jgi:hypothetical protein
MAAEYQYITNYDGVKRYIDEATIPPDEANRDWQEFLAWDAIEGNDPDPAPVPPEVVPVPDPNVRLDSGVQAAVETYNAPIVDQQGGSGGLSVEERLLRLEESLKAMCNGQMADTGGTAFGA